VRLVGQIALIAHDAVTAADLIHPAGAVADPLPGYENRHLHMEREIHLLERGGVVVAKEVADKSLVLAIGFCPAAI